MKSYNKTIAALAIAGATVAGGAAGAIIASGAAGAQDAGTATTAPATAPSTAPAAQAPTAPSADPGAAQPPADPQAPQGSQTPKAPNGPKGQRPPKDPSAGGHQANGKTETLLTGDELAKVTAAVEQAAPGATIERAETDAEGDAFEAHIVQADGTKATVKFAADYSLVKIETGPAK
jgi:hypothetical protein